LSIDKLIIIRVFTLYSQRIYNLWQGWAISDPRATCGRHNVFSGPRKH